MSPAGAVRASRVVVDEVAVSRRRLDGAVTGTVSVDPTVFGVAPNKAVMHQVVTAQLAGARSGTHSTRTRAEVRGGGAKPWRQKGTGRARAGSTRSPIWVGGGIAHGPKPRSYAQRTPRKMVRLALASALSDRMREGRICVVDAWTFDEPRTKEAARALDRLGLAGSVLVVLGPDDEVAWRSFANLAHVRLTIPGELNTFDVLRSDWVVFTTATLPGAVGPIVEITPPEDTAAEAAPAASEAPGEAADTADDEAGAEEDADAEEGAEGAEEDRP